jgi:hypothetical protein
MPEPEIIQDQNFVPEKKPNVWQNFGWWLKSLTPRKKWLFWGAIIIGAGVVAATLYLTLAADSTEFYFYADQNNNYQVARNTQRNLNLCITPQDGFYNQSQMIKDFVMEIEYTNNGVLKPESLYTEKSDNYTNEIEVVSEGTNSNIIKLTGTGVNMSDRNSEYATEECGGDGYWVGKVSFTVAENAPIGNEIKFKFKTNTGNTNAIVVATGGGTSQNVTFTTSVEDLKLNPGAEAVFGWRKMPIRIKFIYHQTKKIWLKAKILQ